LSGFFLLASNFFICRWNLTFCASVVMRESVAWFSETGGGKRQHSPSQSQKSGVNN
jgi:hypothetical protein